MRVLVIRLGSMGDVILSTPVVSAIRKASPDAIVDFIVKKEYCCILEGNPNIDRVIPFDSKGANKGLKGLLCMVHALKRGKPSYTHVIDLHGNLRSRIISSLLSGAKTFRYDKQAIKRRMRLFGVKSNIKHTVEAYMTALEQAGLISGNPELLPLIEISGEEEGKSKRLINKLDLTGKSTLIGLAPGAMWPTKMWLKDRFVEVGNKAVEELNASVIVFGGPEDKSLCEYVAGNIRSRVLSVAGNSSVRETAALIKRCDILLSNDSGPMHIASAVGTPVVAVFGPTVRDFGFSPLGKSSVVETNLPCRPCSLHGSNECPKGHFKCMKDVEALMVFDEMKSILEM